MRAGIPSLALAAEAFRGQQAEFSFGAAYAFTETGGPGKVYRYKFSTVEIKTPLQDAVTAPAGPGVALHSGGCNSENE